MGAIREVGRCEQLDLVHSVLSGRVLFVGVICSVLFVVFMAAHVV